MSELMIPIGQLMSDEDFNKLATSPRRFLPRVQLISSKSERAQQGKFPGGHYAFITGKDDYKDLGDVVDFLPVNYRAKAIDFNSSPPISVFDMKSPEFDRIREMAGEKESNCLFGPEFLLWIPTEEAFATFHCYNITLQNEAPHIKKLLGQPATFRVKWNKNKKGTWQGPVVTTCSTPFAAPNKDLLQETVHNFVNPPEQIVEEENEEEPGRAR